MSCHQKTPNTIQIHIIRVHPSKYNHDPTTATTTTIPKERVPPPPPPPLLPPPPLQQSTQFSSSPKAFIHLSLPHQPSRCVPADVNATAHLPKNRSTVHGRTCRCLRVRHSGSVMVPALFGEVHLAFQGKTGINVTFMAFCARFVMFPTCSDWFCDAPQWALGIMVLDVYIPLMQNIYA